MAKSWPPTWLTPIDDEALAKGKGDLAIEFVEAFGVMSLKVSSERQSMHSCSDPAVTSASPASVYDVKYAICSRHCAGGHCIERNGTVLDR